MRAIAAAMSAVAAATAAAACGDGSENGTRASAADVARARDEGPIVIVLDVFSGRPNPSWIVHGAAAREVRIRLRRAGARTSSPLRAGLGYRGFELDGGERRNAPGDRRRVACGVVEVRNGSRVRRHEDDGMVERLLLRQARERGYGDLVASRRCP